MKRFKLTKEEKAIERDIGRGVYKPVPKAEFDAIVDALQRWRKDAVLNLRVNSEDLKSIKKKAKKKGIPYQTFISEFLHRLAA